MTNWGLSNWIQGQFPDGYRGWCVDVGASDGHTCNSTLALEKQWGWTVLSVEGNPTFKKALMASRAWVDICAVGEHEAEDAPFGVNQANPEAYSGLKPSPSHPQAGKVWITIKVPVRTLEQLLLKWQFPRLDALCIDVEGSEEDVLRGIDLMKWNPRVIVVENWEEGRTDNFLRARGWERKFRTVDNDCYVKESVKCTPNGGQE